MANSVASVLIWQERTGETQDIHVDLRKAWVIQSCWQDVLAHCTMINGVSVMAGQVLTQNPITKLIAFQYITGFLWMA
jgi:hypothetical protein